MNKTRMGWFDTELGIKYLCEDILREHKKIDRVVVSSKDALPCGTMMSYAFNCGIEYIDPGKDLDMSGGDITDAELHRLHSIVSPADKVVLYDNIITEGSLIDRAISNRYSQDLPYLLISSAYIDLHCIDTIPQYSVKQGSDLIVWPWEMEIDYSTL